MWNFSSNISIKYKTRAHVGYDFCIRYNSYYKFTISYWNKMPYLGFPLAWNPVCKTLKWHTDIIVCIIKSWKNFKDISKISITYKISMRSFYQINIVNLTKRIVPFHLKTLNLKKCLENRNIPLRTNFTTVIQSRWNIWMGSY